MIWQLRQRLAAELKNEVWPVYPYKPDDLTDVPSIVVDRPTIAIDVQHNVFTTPIVVIGRRDGSEDAQSELDDVASWVARNVAGPEFAVTRIEPATATVAELTYPAYELTVSCGVTTC